MKYEQAKKNIKLTIEYDGSEYAGWQIQPEQKTIQGVIEDELKKISPDSSRLIAAGRTDTGVHALGQIACFKTAVTHSPQTIKKALNALLPSAINIIDAEYCELSFHPRYAAKGKSYTYLIHTGQNISPFLYRYVWSVNYRINIAEMKKASSHLEGRHDFSSFQSSGCSAKNQTREIFSLGIKRLRTVSFLGFKVKGNFIVITIEANAFLRHMIRNIAGTLIETGRGKLTEKDVGKILSVRDRTRSGPTAPPQGLFLEKVFY